MKKVKEKIQAYFREYEVLIKNRHVLKLLFAGLISSFGTKLSYLALLGKVARITDGSITDLGFLTIIGLFPSIVFGIFAGIIIDKVSRKKVMIASDLLNGLVILSVIFINDITFIYVAAFLKASVNVFRMPSQNAFEPNLVEKEDIPLLQSFKSSVNGISNIVSYSLAAVLVGLFGINFSFMADAATYFISAFLILTISLKESHLLKITKSSGKVWQTIKSDMNNFMKTVRLVWKIPKIKLIVMIESFIVFAMSMQGILIYVFIRETLKMGDQSEAAWGILLAALGVGSIIGSILLGVKIKYHKNSFKLFLNILLFDAVSLALFSLNTFFPVSILLFMALGIIAAGSNIIFNTIMQSTVNDENRGKIFASLGMLYDPIGAVSIFIGTTIAVIITAQGVLIIAAGLEALIAILIRFTPIYKKIDDGEENE